MYQLAVIIPLIFISISSVAQERELKKANKFYESRDYLFAERHFEVYLEDREDFDAQKKLLHCYKAQSKDDELDGGYESLLKSGNQEFALEYAMYLLNHEQYDKAEKQLNDIIAKEPDNKKAQQLLKFLPFKKNLTEFSCTKNIESKYCVEISGAKSIDEENPNYTFYWTFEDGVKRTGLVVSRCYDEPGEHSVSLTVKDNISGHVEPNVKKETFVFEPSPTFNFGSQAQISISAGDETEFKAHCDSATTTVVWDFGDGYFGIGNEIKHTYDRADRSTIRMYLMDSEMTELTGCVEEKVPVLFNFKNK